MKILHQNHIKYGLFMTFIVALCLVFMEITGQNQTFDQKSPVIFLGMMVAPFIIWFLGIRAKKQELKNKMNFKQGLREGFLISLTYGITSPFVFAAYYLFINPAIIDYVRIAYNLGSLATGLVIVADMLVQFISALIFGTIYGAIVSFLLKTRSAKK